MHNEFTGIMSTRTDVELLTILNSPPGDYKPLALEAAGAELKKRNLSAEQMIVAKEEIKRKEDLIAAQNNEPLSLRGKIISFIFPNLLSTLLWKTYLADGNKQRYKEKIRWQLYGLCFYIIIILIIVATA